MKTALFIGVFLATWPLFVAGFVARVIASAIGAGWHTAGNFVAWVTR